MQTASTAIFLALTIHFLPIENRHCSTPQASPQLDNPVGVENGLDEVRDPKTSLDLGLE